MIGELANACGYLFQVDIIAVIFLGCFIGLVFGALPGLGGTIALAITLPFTYGWESMPAMFFYSAILGGVPFGGSVSAILINTPGTPENAATTFDGYPMARKGEGGKAIGISATASGLGAIFGIFVLLTLIPVVRQVVLLFGPPEFFMLVLFGLITVAFAARGNTIKGLISGILGMLISFIGFSNALGVLRFIPRESEYLWDGIRLIPFCIGIFAVAELISLSLKGGVIAGEKASGKMSGVWDGAKEVFKYKLCFLRSSVIGVIVGIVPGIGAAVSNFLAYALAIPRSKHPELFGKGNPEGVVACESANNATFAGALLPTIAFGIPGSAGMVLILAAFIFHGLIPGPMIMRENLDVVFALILGLLFSNIIASTFGMLAGNVLSRLTTIKVIYIIPNVLMLCLLGSYAYRGNFWDVIVSLLAGIFGYTLVKAGYSQVCLLIGYVLGSIAERAFFMSLASSYGSYGIFFTRPISLFLLIVILSILLFPILQKVLVKKRSKL